MTDQTTQTQQTDRVTQAELSRRLNVSRSAVSKAIKTGRITAGTDGRFDPEEAERQWRANTRDHLRAASESPAAKSKAVGYAEARAKRERHLANISEMREAEMRGRSMKTELVLDIIANLNFGWRSFIDHLPIHLAKVAIGKRDLGEIEMAIEREIDDRMEDLSELMGRLAYQDKSLALPPSPLEQELLERMAADTQRRLNAIYSKAFAEVVELIKRHIGIDLPDWDFVKSE